MSNLHIVPKILPAIKTDPSLIELTMKLTGPPRGPGIWKLNTSILQDEKYNIEIKTLIDTAWNELEGNDNLALRFDRVKYKIRQFSIAYGKQMAKRIREQKTKTIKEIESLDEKICNETISDQELNVYEEFKKKLEDMEKYKARGEWIRSRLEHLESNEKSTAFFYNISKQTYEKKKQ